jgi:hypothetical protein
MQCAYYLGTQQHTILPLSLAGFSTFSIDGVCWLVLTDLAA